jgi:hypothetical protein
MRRPSEGPVFRELNGIEARTIFIDDLTAEFRRALESAIDESNKFYVGNSYPVTRISGEIYIKIFPSQKLPEAIPIYIKLHYGTSMETALDKIREDHGIEVLQAVKTKSGLIVNQPVEEKDNARED